jgi:hypothetical protein
MSSSCPTVTVKATDPEQGEFIVINKSDYDAAEPGTYEMFVLPLLPPPGPPPVAAGSVPPGPLDALGSDWQNGDVAEMKAIAAAVSGRAVDNKAQAIEVIDAALVARAK